MVRFFLNACIAILALQLACAWLLAPGAAVAVAALVFVGALICYPFELSEGREYALEKSAHPSSYDSFLEKRAKASKAAANRCLFVAAIAAYAAVGAYKAQEALYGVYAALLIFLLLAQIFRGGLANGGKLYYAEHDPPWLGRLVGLYVLLVAFVALCCALPEQSKTEKWHHLEKYNFVVWG